MNLSILRTAAHSFGCIKRLAADDIRPTLLSVVHIEFENGALTIEAVPEDDTLKLSVGPELEAGSQELSDVPPWSVLIGGTPIWFWSLTNHQGYTDGLQLLFRKDGKDIGFQIVVMATSLKPYLVIEQ